MNQRGFATLEVILMIVVIGILATIAIPRFANITAAANTAKIQADLSTIDTAISISVVEGNTPSELKDLEDYIKDAKSLKPPTGKCYIDGEIDDVPAKEYKITKPDDEEDLRATLDNKTVKYFSKVKISDPKPNS